jgi:hypothetical protein
MLNHFRGGGAYFGHEKGADAWASHRPADVQGGEVHTVGVDGQVHFFATGRARRRSTVGGVMSGFSEER